MRAKSTRIILLTEFPELEHPDGLIVPPASTILQNSVRSERTIIWDMEDDSEVTGTVEIDRSVLWDVQAEEGPTLVNYIEIPFFQQKWSRDADLGVNYASEYRGILRLWESGTVQLVGEIRTSKQADEDYIVGVGSGIPALYSIGTATAGIGGAFGALVPVSWSHKMLSGEFFIPVTSITGQINTAAIVEYPTGWILPHTQYAIPDPGYIFEANISRSGDNLVTQGNVGPTGPGVNWGLVSYVLDVTTWTLSSQVIHGSGSPPGAYGPVSKAIPDSATVGAIFDHQLGAGLGGSVRNTNAFIGPIFRTAYSTPTIQQGIDPEA